VEVGIWMTRELITVAPGSRVSAAALTMSRRRVRRLLVTVPGTRGPRLLGIISTQDVARVCPADINPFSAADWPAGTDPTVETVMSRQVQTVTPATPIEEAACAMRTHKIGALPVVQGERVVGLLTESDVLDALLEIIGVGRTGVRITFEAHKDEDVLGTVVALGKTLGMQPVSIFSMVHRDRESRDARHLGVVRLAGHAADTLIDAIWRSGHPVRSVLRTEAPDADESHGVPSDPTSRAS
jgi:acetoin utilization protein AcuB